MFKFSVHKVKFRRHRWDLLEYIRTEKTGIRCRFVFKSSVTCRMKELADAYVMKRQNKR